jgi:hypothetical protein
MSRNAVHGRIILNKYLKKDFTDNIANKIEKIKVI